MGEKASFFVLRAKAVPEVLLRVVEAKRLLEAFFAAPEKFENGAAAHTVARAKIGENGEWNLSGERYIEASFEHAHFPVLAISDVCEINPKKSELSQFPAETRDYVPMVIAAAWLFLHPKQYGLDFPRPDAQVEPLKVLKPTTIYELTICLGDAGSREGWMRTLRNLNPRYQPDGWIPAGTVLNANKRIAGLYGRNCLNGARAADTPGLPLTPNAVAGDARASRAAGAACLHIHPRDAMGRESLAPPDVAAHLSAVRKAVPGEDRVCSAARSI